MRRRVRTLARVLLGLGFKHEIIKNLLELLVRRIDEDLFKPIGSHVFEPKNVQDTNELALVGLVESFIGALDEPVEQAAERWPWRGRVSRY